VQITAETAASSNTRRAKAQYIWNSSRRWDNHSLGSLFPITRPTLEESMLFMLMLAKIF
jgi:hypothetical protein